MSDASKGFPESPGEERQKPKYQIFSFRTDHQWSARNLAALLDSTRTIYQMFLACVVRTRLEDRYVRYTLDNLKRYEYLYKEFLIHPALIDRLRLQQEICQVWKRERIPNFDNLAPFLSVPFPQNVPKEWVPPVFPEEIPIEKLPDVREIYKYLSFYIAPEEELRIKRLEIPTPGIVCFEGVDTVVEQIRSLIREVSRLERDAVPLSRQEVIEKNIQTHLKLRDVAMPPLPRYVKLSSRMDEQIEILMNLQTAGKLWSLDAYIDHPPDAAFGSE